MKKLFALLLCLLALCGTAAADSFLPVWGDGGAYRSIYTDITTDDDAPVLTLLPQEPVSDLTLSLLTWEEDHLDACLLWSMARLAPGQVIHLQGWLGEVIPRFRLTWTDAAGQAQTCYLMESGEDGSLLLTPAYDLDEMMPDAWAGLWEAESRTHELLAELQEDLTAAELQEAAGVLYDLWDDQRLAMWGGHAVSAAETDWEAERWAQMYAAGDLYAGTQLYTLILSAAGAELTRSHVFTLAGLPVPDIHALG